METWSEEEFQRKIDTVVKPHLSANVREAYFTTTDGKRLHYHFAVPPGAKAVIVMVHGFCEFYGKYHEMTYYFWQKGYGFYFLEQRGHGFSAREEAVSGELDKVTVDSYDSYVQDLREFKTFIVDQSEPALPKLLFAHSMGGAVSTLFLEQYPGEFRAAVLSSPMLQMKTGTVPPWKVRLLMILSVLLRWDQRYVPGQHGFDGVEDYEHSSTLSPARYHYIFTQRLETPEYRTWGGTYAWMRASLSATKKLQKHFDTLTLPILLCQAGMDTLVDPAGHEGLRTGAKDVTFLSFPEAKHEIFHAGEETRARYYDEVFSFFEAHRADAVT